MRNSRPGLRRRQICLARTRAECSDTTAQTLQFISSNPDFEEFTAKLYDDDAGFGSTGDDFLGSIEIHVSEIKEKGRIVQTYQLENKDKGVTSGELDLSLAWEDMFD